MLKKLVIKGPNQIPIIKIIIPVVALIKKLNHRSFFFPKSTVSATVSNKDAAESPSTLARRENFLYSPFAISKFSTFLLSSTSSSLIILEV